MPYQAVADAVLLLHVAVVIFVVLGLPATIIGSWRKMAWVNGLRWRSVHLLAIAVVVLQAWLGQHCGLTVLESWLRQQAGQAGYERGFIEHWLQSFLYYEGPLWVFALAYTVFGAVVAWAWWRYPPKVSHAARGDAVGTGITPRPPHRSVRAELPHTAPASGTNDQTPPK